MNSVLSLIDEAVRKHGGNTALDDDESALSYDEFYEEYMAAAEFFIEECKETRSPIVIYLPQSVESVVLFMGALASGNIYVPVDFKTPLLRLESMLDNLEPTMVVTNEEGKKKLEEAGRKEKICIANDIPKKRDDGKKAESVKAEIIDTDPAYIMYTSGSTGTPKGVVITHRGIINYALWVIKTFDICESDVLGMQSGFHFDNSVFDIYASLFTGAKLLIIPEILFMYPEQLIELMEKKEVSCIFWVPTVMINVANSGALKEGILTKLRTVAFAGEVMPVNKLNVWKRALPDKVYANLYGPTEITVDCTCYVVDRDFDDSEKLPIGKEIDNTKVYIMTEDGKLCEKGEEGELCVAGVGVAPGYWNNKDMTDRVFIQNPLNGEYPEVLYKTGDIAYEADDGNIMYVGRRDGQFKLRGNRIEPGDIEAAAMRLDFVKRACAVFDREEEIIILAIESDEDIQLKKFNMKLMAYVPKYMLPKKLIVLDKMPLTPNKKTDRKRIYQEYVKRDADA